MDRALLWLHEQEVVRLNKGLAVFRPAMTILLKPEQRGFARADFASLQLHYDEQIRQIHVMAEYAQHGLSQTADHLKLAMDYFILPEGEFLELLAARSGSGDLTADHARVVASHRGGPEQSDTSAAL